MRVPILLSFWRAHKGQRRVLRTLRWFMARMQSQGGSRWDTPAALGFLVTVVTRIAENATGPLAPDALARLQGASWNALTGLPSEPLGEHLVLLSAGRDPVFLEGCRRGVVFAEAVEAARHAPDRAGAQRDLAELWDSLLIDMPAA